MKKQYLIIIANNDIAIEDIHIVSDLIDKSLGYKDMRSHGNSMTFIIGKKPNISLKPFIEHVLGDSVSMQYFETIQY